MPELSQPPQKPARPSRNFSLDSSNNGPTLNHGVLKVVPSVSINLENVNSPNNSQINNIRFESQDRSHSPSSPRSNITNIQDYTFNDGESQLSLLSKADETRVPKLTIYNNEQDQISIMENELDELMNDDDGLMNDFKSPQDQIDNRQINIYDLLNKIMVSNIGMENQLNMLELDKLKPKAINQDSNDTNENDYEHEKLEFLSHKKQFFILSSSGKPIYSFFGSDKLVVNYMSIIQTLISSFNDPDLNPVIASSRNDNLKSFKAGPTSFVVLNKDPIYLLAISSHSSESAIELKNQLYVLYNYILSILSKKQLVKFYSLKPNFDLANVLNASDYSLLNKVLISKILNPVFFLNGIESFYLHHSMKLRINAIIEKFKSTTKPNEMLYGILSDLNGKVITIMKPRKHFLHTSDLQILFSIIFSKSNKSVEKGKKIVINKKIAKETSNNSVDFANFEDLEVDFSNEEELWFPICLPEFNSNGFLYCFVNYIDINNIEIVSKNDEKVNTPPANSNDPNKLVFIVLSPDKNAFFNIRQVSKKIILEIMLSSNSQIWNRLIKAFKFNYCLNYLNFLDEFNKKHPNMNITGSTPRSLANNFFHFIFKSKKNSQIFIPSFNSLNVSSINTVSFEQLMFLYKELSNNLNQSQLSPTTFTPFASTSTSNTMKPQHNDSSNNNNNSNTNFSAFNGITNPFTGMFGGSEATTEAPSRVTNNKQSNPSDRKKSREKPMLSEDSNSGIPHGYSPIGGKSSLIYSKWNINGINLIGIAYSNSNYELFVIVKETRLFRQTTSKKNHLVENLKVIINWIFKNFNRLFITGLTF
ncbi:Mon1 protein [Saccharomycopsis crataegensis]|uniref:Vacuolar fusion protein MON1 n=1 Tax=Saccharomycopsis crataegensis TaxID=43959 RepID=A0AAV5QEX9_9ASCO|nr:Mon1 protein [Saccharomycopsis crataegensis]